MTVVQRLEILSSLIGQTAPVWWSPLSREEVEQTLHKLGAQRLSGDERSARFALELAHDPLAQSLVVEPRGCERGSTFTLRSVQLGFGRDFRRVVQGGLTLFALLVAWTVTAHLNGQTVLAALAAVGVVWALVMGLYAALRATTHGFVENRRAYERASSKVRIALFARSL